MCSVHITLRLCFFPPQVYFGITLFFRGCLLLADFSSLVGALSCMLFVRFLTVKQHAVKVASDCARAMSSQFHFLTENITQSSTVRVSSKLSLSFECFCCCSVDEQREKQVRRDTGWISHFSLTWKIWSTSHKEGCFFLLFPVNRLFT